MSKNKLDRFSIGLYAYFIQIDMSLVRYEGEPFHHFVEFFESRTHPDKLINYLLGKGYILNESLCKEIYSSPKNSPFNRILYLYKRNKLQEKDINMALCLLNEFSELLKTKKPSMDEISDLRVRVLYFWSNILAKKVSLKRVKQIECYSQDTTSKYVSIEEVVGKNWY